MKKFIICICTIIASCFSVKAQNNAQANLNVQLNTIQSIRINEGQSDVTIALNTADEYINGKSSSLQDHIEIMSSSDYEIKVSASSNLVGDAASIDIGTVSIIPSLGSIGESTQGALNLSPINLSLADNTIVQSSQGDSKRSFNIEYHVSGGEEYLNKPTGSYNTLITYTIIAP